MGNDAGERRRVAELLRQNAPYCDTDTFEDFYMSLNNILFGDTGLQRSDAEIFDRLAGLVDPDTGVNYMEWKSGNAGGICVMENADDTPYVGGDDS